MVNDRRMPEPTPFEKAVERLAMVVHQLDTNLDWDTPAEVGLRVRVDLLEAAREVVRLHQLDAPPPTDLPYQDMPAPITGPTIHVDAISDNITTKVMTLTSSAGVVGAIEVQFLQARLDGPPQPMATATFVQTPELLRLAGKLLRDACNAAANRAEAGE